MKQPTRFVDADHIKEQARRIRDIMQEVVVACELGQVIEPHARNKIMGGSIGADVVALAIEMMKFETENG